MQLSLALGGVTAPEDVKEETPSDGEAAPPVSCNKRVLTQRDSFQQFAVSPMEWETSQKNPIMCLNQNCCIFN